MCGIAGIVAKRNGIAIAPTLFQLSQSMKHRGPDGEGFLLANATEIKPFASENTSHKDVGTFSFLPQTELQSQFHAANYTLGLAHRRLSIIDVSAGGHQPMCNDNQTLWISFNGEIYNYIELREELKQQGFSFQTNSDTEVLLKAYQYWGQTCVERFNGMWSFCIYDAIKQELFCSRDRLGVKPFYYLHTNQHFAFASEQKAFVKSGLIIAKANEKALHNYFINAQLENETSNFFESISELFPGHNLVYQLKEHRLETTRYFSLSGIREKDNTDELSLIKKVKTTFENAIRLRLRSDVEVGSCLSGGIDSSSIVVSMAALSKNRLHCFTSDFEGGEGNYAKAVAEKVNAHHHICHPTEEALFKDLETLTYALDTPTWDTSTYAQFSVMRLAKQKGIKVVLDGQGADELFAGYHHHYLPYWNNLSLFNRLNAINAASKSLPNPFLFYLKERIKGSSKRHFRATAPFFKSDFVMSHPYANPTHYEKTVNAQLQNDIEKTRLKTFLRCEDRCGMWHSVESRTPFSDDIHLIQLAFEINGQQKIKHGKLKYLLREAMKEKLPSVINQRYDKMGFTTPMQTWLSKRKTQMWEIVRDAAFDFVNYPELEKQIQKSDLSFLTLSTLYKLYLFCLWQKVFNNNKH
jgi:asparagine synthase (glutamine-hydrolysing)